MSNTKVPLEIIILHLWNGEIQNIKFNLISHKFNKCPYKKTLKNTLRTFDDFKNNQEDANKVMVFDM